MDHSFYYPKIDISEKLSLLHINDFLVHDNSSWSTQRAVMLLCGKYVSMPFHLGMSTLQTGEI
jgi:hypothetical protein